MSTFVFQVEFALYLVAKLSDYVCRYSRGALEGCLGDTLEKTGGDGGGGGAELQLLSSGHPRDRLSSLPP